jgi:hypothetical protein
LTGEFVASVLEARGTAEPAAAVAHAHG